MTADSVLAEGRAAAEALMTDSVAITRPGGATGQDEVTGRIVAGASPVWSGPCKVQAGQSVPATSEVAGRMQTVQRYELHLPVSAVGVRVGDVAVITVAGSDPQLVGRRFRVAGEHHKSRATAQRLPVEEVTS